MRKTTTAALALAGTAALSIPAAADAAPITKPRDAAAEKALLLPGNHGDAERRVRAVRREAKRDVARRRTVRLARRADKAGRVELPDGYDVRLADDSIRELAARRVRLRAQLHPETAGAGAAGAGAPGAATGGAAEAQGGGGAGGALSAIRACESGGDYSANTGNGFYGAYQFDQQTWQSVGGSGNPASASPAEQDAAAARLMAQRGSSPWPVCGS